MPTFPNLARRFERCSQEDLEKVDITIRDELQIAGIQIVNLAGPQKECTEVPYSCLGVLGRQKDVEEANKFSHLWDIGLRESMTGNWTFEFIFDRRWYYWSVRGFVPLEVAKKIYAHPTGKTSVRMDGHCGCLNPGERGNKLDWIGGMYGVRTYHIDNQEGLNLFVDEVKKAGLVRS